MKKQAVIVSSTAGFKQDWFPQNMNLFGGKGEAQAQEGQWH